MATGHQAPGNWKDALPRAAGAPHYRKALMGAASALRKFRQHVNAANFSGLLRGRWGHRPG
jgi:hypothetical protein